MRNMHEAPSKLITALIILSKNHDHVWLIFIFPGNGRVCLVFPPKPDPPPINAGGPSASDTGSSERIQLDIVPPTPQVSQPMVPLRISILST